MTDHRSEPLPMRPSQPGPDETRYLFRAIFARRVAVIAAFVVLTALLVTSTTTVVLIRQQQNNNVSTFDLLVDCTNPDGTCYQDGQQRTAEAVGSITDVSARAAAYAAGCADEPGRQTTDEIFRCVMDRLTEDGLAS